MLSKFLKSSPINGMKQLVTSGGNKTQAFFGACNVNSLHRFGDEIESKVMNKMQTQISKPTIRPTQEREAYSEKHDKTPHCNGC